MSNLVREPIYQQLNQLLKELIESGEYQPEAKFLTEREIASRFNVSRPTANKALASLVSEGILDFKKGIGTFVSRPSLDYDLRSLMSFSERARLEGKVPNTEVLKFEKVSAADHEMVREQLGVSKREKLFYIERLRKADDTPVIYEQRWTICKDLPEPSLETLSGSLYDWWQNTCGLSIEGAEQTLRATLATPDSSKILKVKKGSALMELSGLGFMAGGKPLWWEKTYYRSDQYEFHVHLGKSQANSAGHGSFIA